MSIPTTNYPQGYDGDRELFLVHDSLRLTLAEDWQPGQDHLVVYEDDDVMSRFPETGTITLVEQCSPVAYRAVGFFYESKTPTSFEGLKVLPGYENVSMKPKDYTHVVQSVAAIHHDNLKDATLAIEQFLGLKGTVAKVAEQGTITERMNLLKGIAFTPKAWFSIDRTIGLCPLKVTFLNQCMRVGEGVIRYHWDFGDGTQEVIDVEGKRGADVVGDPIKKTYSQPGKYTVTLMVKNQYGKDEVSFPQMVTVRVPAPDMAVVDVVAKPGQLIVRPGLPEGGPYTEQTPKIRTPANIPVRFKVRTGQDAERGMTYAGEQLDEHGTILDPIQEYMWGLGDEVPHANLPNTDAIFGMGGNYDMHLTVETTLGAYAVTSYYDAVDVVERRNLWLWTFQQDGIHAKASEFGLTSETFKSAATEYPVVRHSEFLDGTPNEEQAKQEFLRNTAFAPRGTAGSGERGTAMLFWARGYKHGESMNSQEIDNTEYEAFSDIYTDYDEVYRPWNWAALVSPTHAYFILGNTVKKPVPNTNPTNPEKLTYDLSTLATSTEQMNKSTYKNGADELTQNVTGKYTDGVPDNGYFAVYRTCWRDGVGYFLRNNNVGKFFEIRDFYRTEGILDEEFRYLVKGPSLLGTDKVEGQLVPLSEGVFFFNNSAAISAYNPHTDVWETGGPSSSSVDFRSYQDIKSKGFQSLKATLLAASDGDNTAYLSFDYSPNTFLKFDFLTLTFHSLPSRPSGTQFVMGVY